MCENFSREIQREIKLQKEFIHTFILNYYCDAQENVPQQMQFKLFAAFQDFLVFALQKPFIHKTIFHKNEIAIMPHLKTWDIV